MKALVIASAVPDAVKGACVLYEKLDVRVLATARHEGVYNGLGFAGVTVLSVPSFNDVSQAELRELAAIVYDELVIVSDGAAFLRHHNVLTLIEAFRFKRLVFINRDRRRVVVEVPHGAGKALGIIVERLIYGLAACEYLVMTLAERGLFACAELRDLFIRTGETRSPRS